MNNRDRAWRRQQRARIIANRKRFLLNREGPDGILAVRPDGMMADRHPLDCGKRCLMCHGEKLLNAQSRRAEWERAWEQQLDAGEAAECHDDPIHDWRYLRAIDKLSGLSA